MNREQIKVKKKLLSTRGINWLLVDVMRIISEEIEEEVSDEVYSAAVKRITNQLKGEYNVLLKAEDIACKQVDLEDAIEEIYRANKEHEDKVIKKLTE